MHALLLVCYHRLHHVCVTRRFKESEQRMLCTIGVPQREDGVVVKSLCTVDVTVKSTILVVNVHVDGRIYHRVVERSIEHCHLVGCAFALHCVQFFVPAVVGLGVDLLKRLASSFCTEVLQGAVCAYARECNLHDQLLRSRVVEVEVSHDVASADFGEVLVQSQFAHEATIFHAFHVTVAIVFDRLGE